MRESIYNIQDRPRKQLKFAPDGFIGTAIVIFFYYLLISASLSLYIVRDLDIGAGRYLDEIAFASFTALVIIIVLFFRRIYISSVIVGIVLFTAIGVIATIYNRVPIEIAFLGFMQAVKPLVILFVFQLIPLKEASSKHVLKGLNSLFVVLSITAIAYIVVFEFLIGSNPLPAVNQDLLIRLGFISKRSFFTHPGKFASTMVIISFFHFSYYLLTGSKKRLIILILSLIGIALTMRMKPLFMMPICLVILYFLFRYNRGKIKKLHLIVGTALTFLLVIAITITALLTPLRELLESRFAPDTSSVRISLFKGALTILEDTSGIGAGFGMYGSPVSANNHYSPRYFEIGIDQLDHATPEDPSYITDQWWSWYVGETGLLGMIVFTGTLIFIIIKLNGFARYWKGKNVLQTSLAATAMASIIYGILIGLVGNFLAGPPTSYYTMALAGLAFAVHRGLNKENVSEGPKAIVTS